MRLTSRVPALAAILVCGVPFIGSVLSVSEAWASAISYQDTAGGTPSLPQVTGGEIKCENGKAKVFDCRNVDLLSFLPTAAIGGNTPLHYSEKLAVVLSGMWGWTEAKTGREFALVGRVDGTAFVEVTDPVHPKYLGMLPLHEGAEPSFWRELKVYKNHAFIVSDAAGPHGMQVFDLTQLLHVKAPPVTFTETAHYDGIASVHNIVIDPETGLAGALGSNGGVVPAKNGPEVCGFGMHMLDLSTPTKPVFVGCYWRDMSAVSGGYIHDAQCAVYRGPDRPYQGREMCFNASGALVIADVTDRQHPKTVGVGNYPDVGYTHQGWLSEDQRFFFMGDEADEEAMAQAKDKTKVRTRTIIFDVSKLDDPVVATEFMGTTAAIDHNLYVSGRYMYQSNYQAGLRVIDVRDPKAPQEVGYFDTTPYDANATAYGGTWSNYPFFKNGVVAVTSMGEGLFLVRFKPPAP